jgi:photosystem II stability/assembly factor-like uncharacterized protein
MTTSELRRMATPLIERSLIPPDTIEDLKERSGKRRRWRRTRWTHRVWVVAVAAAILVVFFVPLPHVSLFNRLSTRPTGSSNTAPTLRWTSKDLGPSRFNTVACPTPTNCVAFGPAGWIARSEDGGVIWTTSILPNFRNVAFDHVVCATLSSCVAVGAVDNGASTGRVVGIAAVSSDDGASWVRANVLGGVLGDLACPTAKVCYATGTRPSSGALGFFFVSTDGGLNWKVRLAEPKNGFGVPLSCPDARHCWALGGSRGFLATTDGGRSWTPQTEPEGGGGYPGLADLDCFSLLRCVGVGIEHSPGYGIIVVTADGGRSWTIPPSGYTSGDIGGSFESVSCTSKGQCVVVGGQGGAGPQAPFIMESDDGGENWYIPRASLPPPVAV